MFTVKMLACCVRMQKRANLLLITKKQSCHNCCWSSIIWKFLYNMDHTDPHLCLWQTNCAAYDLHVLLYQEVGGGASFTLWELWERVFHLHVTTSHYYNPQPTLYKVFNMGLGNQAIKWAVDTDESRQPLGECRRIQEGLNLVSPSGNWLVHIPQPTV